MNALYLELAERIRGETHDLERAVQRALEGWSRVQEASDDRDLYLDSVALNLDGFYSEKASPIYRERLCPLIPILRQLRRESCWRTSEKQGFFPSLSVLVLSREEADQNRCLYLDMIEEARILVDRDDLFQSRLKALQDRLRELGARKVQRDKGWYWDLKPDLRPGEVVIL